MALRDILILPDKRLRQVSKPVGKVDAATRQLVEDMVERGDMPWRPQLPQVPARVA